MALAMLVGTLTAAACGGDDEPGPMFTDTSDVDIAQWVDVPWDDDTGNLNPSNAAVCERWRADRSDRSEGVWTGSVSACDPGDYLEPGPSNTLRHVNLYRWMAGLPAVTLDDARSAEAQHCALMMDANDQLLHEPPTSWTCYAGDGAQGARLSNLATTPGIAGVDLFMLDTGIRNLGHRRWILANSVDTIGIGSTNGYSCLHLIGGDANVDRRWVAWPPPGEFPIEANNPLSFGSLDEAGWSIQSDTLDLRGANITVTANGQPMTVRVDNQLDPGYGSGFAVSFTPVSWKMQAGTTYSVQVRGLIEDIDYSVSVVSCGG